jgi:hypothetical protein
MIMSLPCPALKRQPRKRQGNIEQSPQCQAGHDARRTM